MNRVFILRSIEIRDRAMAYVGELPLQEPPLAVRIAPHKDKRTLSQNAIMHSIFHRIADATGHDHDEVRNMMVAKFLPRIEVEVGGVRYIVLPSTAKLKVDEMSNFIDQLQAFCAEQGITEAA